MIHGGGLSSLNSHRQTDRGAEVCYGSLQCAQEAFYSIIEGHEGFVKGLQIVSKKCSMEEWILTYRSGH